MVVLPNGVNRLQYTVDWTNAENAARKERAYSGYKKVNAGTIWYVTYEELTHNFNPFSKQLLLTGSRLFATPRILQYQNKSIYQTVNKSPLDNNGYGECGRRADPHEAQERG